MNRYIAFLRAINVGGRNMVKMDRLRSIFESLKFRNVETFIASGNVVFDTKSTDESALERQIEKRLRAELGFDVATFVRSIDDVCSIAVYQPFRKVEGRTLWVAFLKSTPAADAKKKVEKLSSEIDELHVQRRELYWSRIGESALTGALLEKTAGVAATMRNVTTVRKLADKYRVQE